jgi:hypothetical protein
MDAGDLTGLVAVTLGCLIVLVPIAGITARFALKPIVEAFAKMRELQGGTAGRELNVLEQRVALLEQHYQLLEGSIQRIGELKDFDRQLQSGPGTQQ